MDGGFENPCDARILEILATPRTFAVVGCSPDPSRDSHRIARLLLERGHRVVPVHPQGGEILDQPVATSLQNVSEPIDVVDVFRKPDAVSDIVDQTLAVGAPVLWLQLGVIDENAAERAVAAGVTVVMDRCPAIEYRRLFDTDHHP